MPTVGKSLNPDEFKHEYQMLVIRNLQLNKACRMLVKQLQALKKRVVELERSAACQSKG